MLFPAFEKNSGPKSDRKINYFGMRPFGWIYECSVDPATSISFYLAVGGKPKGKYIYSKEEVKTMYEDKTLVCKECGKEFTFTAGEQEFYAERGFVNEPQRCKDCRDARKTKIKTQKEMYTTTCAACGCEAKVPFKPREDRPVYCSDCFAKMKNEE